VLIGLGAVWQRLDAGAPALPGRTGTPVEKLDAMFIVCDAVRKQFAQAKGWEVPALAIPRLFRPPAPTLLPVWT
jgi:hypothetical protein